MLTFNTENMVRQHFAFPATIMDYIFKNAEPKHLIKFYQTCKFFYNKFRRNIIQHLEIVADGEAEVLTPTKTVICVSNPLLEKLADFWITDSFVYPASLRFGKIIPLFCHYTIKKLEFDAYLIWREFEILTEAGKIEEIKLKGICRYQIFVGIEDIIAQVPSAKSIEISDSIFTPTTCASLTSLNHKAKISNIVLQNINEFGFVNVELLKEFILKNADIDCNVHIDFEQYDGDDDDILDLNNTLQKLANGYIDALVNALETKKVILDFAKVSMS
uniref:F-box domain-containing protein n=1 Tax=Panagrolaimus sp. ES5 TaxID=591445 RepID=A0AC34F011_9BILA